MSSRCSQTDVAVRLRDNVPLVNGTANLSVGDFYKYYEKHPTGTCAVDTAKKSHKSAVLGKRVIMLELYIDMEQVRTVCSKLFTGTSHALPAVLVQAKDGAALWRPLDRKEQVRCCSQYEHISFSNSETRTGKVNVCCQSNG